jgi:hypothetical protein
MEIHPLTKIEVINPLMPIEHQQRSTAAEAEVS